MRGSLEIVAALLFISSSLADDQNQKKRGLPTATSFSSHLDFRSNNVDLHSPPLSIIHPITQNSLHQEPIIAAQPYAESYPVATNYLPQPPAQLPLPVQPTCPLHNLQKPVQVQPALYHSYQAQANAPLIHYPIQAPIVYHSQLAQQTYQPSQLLRIPHLQQYSAPQYQMVPLLLRPSFTYPQIFPYHPGFSGQILFAQPQIIPQTPEVHDVASAKAGHATKRDSKDASQTQ